MYVIYINDRPLTLRERSSPGPYGDASPDTHLIARYTGKKKSLLNYVDTLEKSSQKITSIELTTDDLDALWADFRAHYRWIEAAGGVVTNEDNGKQLFIFRRGYWDLPKGKLDEGEDRPTAALREVAEETGLQQIELGQALPTTYHTYRGKKNRILKPTYWYRMTTRQEALVPETGEDILRAEWRDVREVLGSGEPLYENLRSLLNRYAVGR
ncbi:ADP-ribose pyrophosphatase YjhB (NUDIX family) [Neolewinella xylanilytica]|uniref:ADP-ribose pyrophosphatase YjhB (NUDIX family) n=1 Tax=Neolewinella xylanilytica TaxID=1514080 RepID=A0A2S6I3H0_9BACT|nr:NUDIX domain-containing protein [Neolewinella xylanilytica]PPK85703.1 ADP-ribose pyrophosphatase YjhB (NUDIX family) [Neolewinella xylanilytica]